MSIICVPFGRLFVGEEAKKNTHLEGPGILTSKPCHDFIKTFMILYTI